MSVQQRNSLLLLIMTYVIIASSIFVHLYGVTWLLQECANDWHFFFIGLGGAIIANATGAGGGILFIPAFTNMGVSQEESVATSVVIQCFGMTTGAVAWLLSFKKRPTIYRRYESFMKTTVLTAGTASVIGVLLGEYVLRNNLPFSVSSMVSIFSICFGLLILVIHYLNFRSSSPRSQSSTLDMFFCTLIGFSGGIMTSIISIGVGEILLMLLFFRNYPIQISIFMAVVISAITVLAAAPYFIYSIDAVVWGIVMVAAPAAMLGGILGQKLTARLGAVRIKLFCGLWICLTGIIS